MEDCEILALFRERSELALEAVNNKYGRLCRQIAGNILLCSEDAEECVNDAYLRLWESIPPKEPASLRSYVGMIVRRLAISRYHRTHAACRDIRATTPMDELEEVLSADSEVSAHLEAAELAATVNTFLAGLPRQDRIIFVRRYWYLDPPGEIAPRMGKSENYVRVKLHRLRAKLARDLERKGLR